MQLSKAWTNPKETGGTDSELDLFRFLPACFPEAIADEVIFNVYSVEFLLHENRVDQKNYIIQSYLFWRKRSD